MPEKETRHKLLERQIYRLQRRLTDLARQSDRYSYLRLLTFIGGFIINAITFITAGPAWLWLTFLLSAVIFLTTVYIHNRVEEVRTRHTIWLQTTQAQLARMDLDWDNIPPTDLPPDSALALDLDLLGPHSLHRLLNTAVSPQSAQRLKEWLNRPEPSPQTTIERQQRVKELVNRPLFRKRLILNGRFASGERESTTPEHLLQWLNQQKTDPSLRNWVIGLTALAILNILLFLANRLDLIPPIWQLTLAIYALLLIGKTTQISEPFKEASALRDILDQLQAVFRQLENHTYGRTPNLAALCRPFHQSEEKPSTYLRRLNRIVNATGLRGNPILALLLNAPFPYDIFFAYKLQQTRQELAGKLPAWLDIWYELESLSSLANLAYLNPQYTFPTFKQDSQDSLITANQMGHPLLSEAQKICNDFTIPQTGYIGILTGSNMSGKSTFLRTLGVNLILAYAGGPVNAAHLDTAFFRLHTCIRISDSITSGISHFYAEVKCLKSLMTSLEGNNNLPLLYLIDEIFRGTNNRERLIGSRAFIRALANQEGVGLISTHDLELSHLAEEIPSLHNYHFEDSVSDGRLLFDYHLKPGPSPTTNALKIMALEGLPVEVD
jgi:hypothetical protein